MAKSFILSKTFAKAGWKVKIRDRETVEPPHVTVLLKTRAWRWDLRAQTFMDDDPPLRLVPATLVIFLNDNCARFVDAWNTMYPHNPVGSTDMEV